MHIPKLTIKHHFYLLVFIFLLLTLVACTSPATSPTDPPPPPASTATTAPTPAPTDTFSPTPVPRDPPPSATPTTTFTPTPTQIPGMALVPAGAFMMGSESGDSDERPVHEVYLDDFYIDVYEVTNAQFVEFMNDMGNHGIIWLGTGDDDARIHKSGGSWEADSGYEDHPVIEVTWWEAREYCEWREARLPTEAEWEKAARGDLEGRLYPWGDESPVCRAGADNGAKFDDNADCDDTDTEKVGTYRPNGYGLYDMAGNVWEWVADWYDVDYYRNPPYENPLGPSSSSGEYHVLRGGSWNFSPDFVRVAYRHYAAPLSHYLGFPAAYYGFGFRCARSP